MKKRIISLILAACLVLSLSPAVMAEGRHTDFFDDTEHTDLDFDEIEYRHVDVKELIKKIDEIRELAQDAANAKQASELYDTLEDDYYELNLMASLSSLYLNLDINDEYYASEVEYYSSALSEYYDAVLVLTQDLLKSPCAATFEEEMTPEEIEAYLNYEPMSRREIQLGGEESALIQEYREAAAKDYSVRRGGKTWTLDSAGEAYVSGELDSEAYMSIYNDILDERYDKLGAIYLRLVKLRNEIADYAGYDNYADYAYEYIYGRDYSTQEIKTFCNAVKKHMSPLFEKLIMIVTGSMGELPEGDYSGDNVLNTIKPYISSMSDELAESLDYMMSKGYYNTVSSDSKSEGSFTTDLGTLGTGFMVLNPTETFYDFSSTVHEFGHYNNFYYDETDWSKPVKSHDIFEVHSQGMELLFSHFYPEVFGDRADSARIYLIYCLLNAIVDGCLEDEVQQFVYAADDDTLTVEDINGEYARLLKEYGLEEYLDDTAWMDVPHNFESPMYYISYAVSAAGASEFWNLSQSDYFGAVDKYLSFTALDPSYSFGESFAAVGIKRPTSEAYIKELAANIEKTLNVDELYGQAMSEIMGGVNFKDVKSKDWFYSYVQIAMILGLMNGVSEDAFAPYDTATRGMGVTVLWRLCGSPTGEYSEDFTDVADGQWYSDAIAWAASNGVVEGMSESIFAPAARLNREQTATILYRFIMQNSDEYSLAEPSAEANFTDSALISDWAREAVEWCAQHGIVTGRDDGTFDPSADVTRAELAAMVVRLASAVTEQQPAE